MSQHTHVTKHQGRPVTILMGYDRPLDYFFMVITYNDATPADDDEGIVFSNLLTENPFSNNLEPYKEKLKELNLSVPSEMLKNIELDRINKVGNKQYKY